MRSAQKNQTRQAPVLSARIVEVDPLTPRLPVSPTVESLSHEAELAAGLALLIVDTDLRVLHVSPRAQRIVGLHTAHLDALLPDLARDNPELQDLLGDLNACRAEGVLIERRVRGRHDKWYLRRTAAYQAAARAGRRLLVTFSDVTSIVLAKRELQRINAELATEIERRRAVERNLQHERDLLRGILSTSVAAVLVVAPDLRIHFANQRAEELLGRSRAELLHSRFSADEWAITDFTGRALHEPELPSRQAAATGGPLYDFRHTVLRPDGSRRYLSAHAIPLPFRDVEGVVVSLTDVTASHAAELARAASERKFRQMMEVMEDAICIVNRDDRVVYLNPAMRRLAGRDATHATCLRNNHRPGEDCPWCLHHFHTTPDQPRRERSLSDGEHSWILSISNNRLDDRDTDQTMIVVRDLTALRQHEAQRRNFERQMLHGQKLESLGILAGGIAHDFNNLLVGVLGSAGLALETLPANDPARPFVEQIVRAGRRANDLTRQMLAYSGRGSIEREVLQVGEIIDEMRDLLGSSIPKKVRYIRQYAPDTPPTVGDRTQLRQIIMNLVMNAAEAIGDRNGEIRVQTRARKVSAADLAETYFHEGLQPGRYLSIVVEDDGAGMDAETQSRIFDPFFTTKFAGRGLGLAAVIGIIRGHRGAIRLKSRPDQGTRFEVLLPIAEHGVPAERPRPTPAPHDPPQRGTGTILVAEDEPDVRDIVKLSLTRAGYQVILAKDGNEAVEIGRARCNELHALLVDLNMPELGGDEVWNELRKLRPELPLVVTSGYDEQDVLSHFKNAARIAFLPKPFMPAQLNEKLHQVLAPNA